MSRRVGVSTSGAAGEITKVEKGMLCGIRE